MATAPSARRLGVARLTLSVIARWAHPRYGVGLYLQVEQSNEPARRLYERAGFTPLATYHCRVRDTRTGH